MAIRLVKPTTPGRRGLITQDFDQITTDKPVKGLLRPRHQRSGRNARGVITVRRRGGGAKRHYRVLSWKLPDGFEATVKEIEYDPNRSARIARIQEVASSHYHYILAPKGIRQGATIKVGPEAPIEVGNRLPLAAIPLGTLIHAIELEPGRGAQLVRVAGQSARLAAKDGGYAQIRLPSNEIRLVKLEAKASIGVVGNEQHQNIKLGKAGRQRWLGRRPRVRGVAMNAADHPHGGGEAKGKNYKFPMTPWGQKTLGLKTRSRRKSNAMIVRRRPPPGRRRRG